MSSSIAQKITALREIKQITQEELAVKLQVSRPLVAAWESGRSNPNIQKLKEIAKVFGVKEYEKLWPRGVVLPDRYDLQKLSRAIIDNGEGICESLSEDLRRGAFNPIIQEVLDITSRETRRDRKPHEAYYWRHPLDEVAHRRFLKLIEDDILPFFPQGLIVFSEELIHNESGMVPEILPKSARDDLKKNAARIQDYVIIDPLDRTAEAVRGIAGFANITVGSLAHGPLVSVVFSLFDRHVNCYYALTGEGAWVQFRNGTSQRTSPSAVVDVKGASLAAYVGRPIRLTRLAAYESFLTRHDLESPFINASGCFGFCLVASSQVDAFIEVAKGYAWHDIVSGHHILHEAGGIVRSLDFTSLSDPLYHVLDPLDKKGEKRITEVSTEAQLEQLAKTWSLKEPTMDDTESSIFQVRRYPFIAAGNYEIAGQIAHELGKTKIAAATRDGKRPSEEPEQHGGLLGY
jgi:transcriptional regulator with XRE-family HTH domain/fructose-1,6-bisphosphatase/inositol monophosphatase family enzyme